MKRAATVDVGDARARLVAAITRVTRGFISTVDTYIRSPLFSKKQ